MTLNSCYFCKTVPRRMENVTSDLVEQEENEQEAFPDLSLEMIQKLHIDGLKNELRLRGLKVSGSKEQLLTRLKGWITNNESKKRMKRKKKEEFEKQEKKMRLISDLPKLELFQGKDYQKKFRVYCILLYFS